MKKTMKRIASMVLAMVMVFAMAMPAMAAEQPTEVTEHTIKINSTKGHTYEAYQIFEGKVATQKKEEGSEEKLEYILSDIEWGTGVNKEAADFEATIKTALGKKDVAEFDATNAQAVADVLKEDKTGALAKTFAQAIAKFLTNVKISVGGTAYEQTTYELSVADAGYYLIKDADNTQDKDGGAYTAFILQVIGKREVTAKSGAPTLDKEVKDVNDSIKGEGEWGESADHDLGEDISFRQIATIGDEFDEYDHYYLAFHDVQSDGLTFNKDSVVVKIGKAIVDEESGLYEVLVRGADDAKMKDTECTFEVVIKDLKATSMAEYGVITKDTKITIEYTSQLNENAVVGDPGNKNTAHLEYSNDPNDDYEGGNEPDDEPDTGKTPDELVVVFTYDIDVNKVDEGNKPLNGAEFTLKKWDASANGGNGEWKNVGKLSGTANSKFNFKFVDDGYYCLEETKAPAGYNKLKDPIYFVVTAEHTTEKKEDGTYELTELEVKRGNWNTEEKKVDVDSGIDETDNFKVNHTEKTDDEPVGSIGKNGQGTLDVKNQKGTILPETGGIGTTIFYVVGSVLVLAAVVLLVTKRRMSAE